MTGFTLVRSNNWINNNIGGVKMPLVYYGVNNSRKVERDNLGFNSVQADLLNDKFVSQDNPFVFIATRGGLNTLETTNKQICSRSPHISRDTIRSLKVIFPNYYVTPSGYPQGEANTKGAMTVKASVEYPAGTFKAITFKGATTGSIPALGQIVSDEVKINIPNNTLFYIRVFLNGVNGCPFNNHVGDYLGPSFSGLGTALEAAASGLTDKTMSGTITPNGAYYSPAGIIGQSSKKCFLILGDSKTQGTGDVTTDATLDIGGGARAVGGSYAYSNIGRDSDKAGGFLNGVNKNRLELFEYATHLLCNYGRNDLASLGVDQDGLLTSLKQIWRLGKNSGLSVIQCTIGPSTTSTDSWITTANQTVSNSGWSTTIDGYRKAFNELIRNNYQSYGLSNYFEWANAIESSFESGKYYADGTAYTDDGIHENSAGYKRIRDTANVFIPSL